MDKNLDFWNNFSNKSKLISAHRGYRAIMPENTMIAFEKSLGMSDFIELDVGFTKDGVAIIIHDDTLLRTSNVQKHKEFKVPYKVVDYTYNEILKLDFSSWFIKDDPFDTIKNNIIKKDYLQSLKIQRIPTLKEVLAFIKKHNFPVNIEIKDMKNTKFDKIAVSKIVKIVKTYNIDKLILFSSFNHNYMKQLALLAPNITRAALQENKHPKNLVKYLKSLKVHGYHCCADIVNKNIINELRKNDFFVNVFTVNNSKEKEKLFKQGVKAIFTDFL